MLQLKKRLFETEAQMTRILKAMESMQADISGVAEQNDNGEQRV